MFLNAIIVAKQSLGNFLKFLDPKKYEQYLLERYKGKHNAPINLISNLQSLNR